MTDDGKTDWWTGGAPRPELGREFGRHNDAGYHQVTFEVFLADAREHLGAEVSDETVEEVAAEREAVAADAEARRLMESWTMRTRENREWVQRGFTPIDSSVGRAAAQISSAINHDPELLSALQRSTLNPELLSAFQRATAAPNATVQGILARASAGTYPALANVSQGASADTSLLRDATARAAMEAARDPVLRRALADVDSPAAQAALHAAHPPGRARRPVKAVSDQQQESDPAAAQSEPVTPSAERPDSS